MKWGSTLRKTLCIDLWLITSQFLTPGLSIDIVDCHSLIFFVYWYDPNRVFKFVTTISCPLQVRTTIAFEAGDEAVSSTWTNYHDDGFSQQLQSGQSCFCNAEDHQQPLKITDLIDSFPKTFPVWRLQAPPALKFEINFHHLLKILLFLGYASIHQSELHTTGDRDEPDTEACNVDANYQNAIKMKSDCSNVSIFVSRGKLESHQKKLHSKIVGAVGAGDTKEISKNIWNLAGSSKLTSRTSGSDTERRNENVTDSESSRKIMKDTSGGDLKKDIPILESEGAGRKDSVGISNVTTEKDHGVVSSLAKTVVKLSRHVWVTSLPEFDVYQFFTIPSTTKTFSLRLSRK